MAEGPAEFNPQHNLAEYSVSEIAGGIKRMVEERFGFVRVRGEISGWRGPHSSGHAYFRLKDDKAVLEAVCWKGSLGKLGCKPEEGLEVIATGRITTYPGKSSYQIVIERMEPAGAGALMALLEKRKAALAAEGLFDAARKRPLPFLPRVIGVVTSPTGAVIRDILHRLADRCPVHVLVWPVAVQGEAAAAQIAGAIDGFNNPNPESRIPIPDLLIVARGGGSIEDLWAFNEEIVVRAAANSRIPLISAVGHETDTTLIDYVSDHRAPTPTAAAEKAVPVLNELRLGVSQLRQRLDAALLQWLTRQRERVEGLNRGLPRPQQLLEHATQRLDTAAERLRAALPGLLTQRETQLVHLTARLRPTLLAREIETVQAQLQSLGERTQNAYQRLLDTRLQKLENLGALLAQLDVRQVLKRGFALVRKEGKLVTSAAQAKGALTLVFHDGEAPATTP